MVKLFDDDGVKYLCIGCEKPIVVMPLEYLAALKQGKVEEIDNQIQAAEDEEIRRLQQPEPEPKYNKDEVAAYWGIWKKSIMLCAELAARREGNKATGYLPKELNDNWSKLSEASRELGLWELDERMMYRLEQDLCSEFQRLYVKLVKECSDRGEAVSAAAIYEMAHAAA